MMKKVKNQFDRMYDKAFYLLVLCLNIILFSLCLLCIYIDSAASDKVFALLNAHSIVTDCILCSFLVSFGGAFLLDYAYVTEVKSKK